MGRPPYTTQTAAKHFGVFPWQIRRLFERGLLPPAPRVGSYRIINESDLPNVERALKAAGYLPTEEEVASCH
jgi:DNA-binding transcriptional MerR regulator